MPVDPNDEEQMLTFLREVPDDAFQAVNHAESDFLELRVALVGDGPEEPVLVIELDRDPYSRFAVALSLAVKWMWPHLSPSKQAVVTEESKEEAKAAKAKTVDLGGGFWRTN